MSEPVKKNFFKTSSAAPFVWASLIWGMAGATLCWSLAPAPGVALHAVEWMTWFWSLCLVDLIALALTVRAMFLLVGGSPENRAGTTIQAFYWGVIKLACLVLLSIVLMKGHGIPQSGLLTGLGTLIVVPLLGGAWWSQRILRHA